jgi:putative transcriptional regulator
VSAVKVLVGAGLSMLKAKRAIEAALISKDRAAVELPAVDDIKALARKLKAAGFAIAIPVRDIVNVKALRENLELSQEQFALRFNFPVATVQNWEQGRATPDVAANNFLHVIKSDPAAALRAVEEAV